MFEIFLRSFGYREIYRTGRIGVFKARILSPESGG